MEHERKQVRQATGQEQQTDAGRLRTGGGQELGTVEEALRVDRARVRAPEGLAARVAEAIRRLPGDRWWLRWFSGRSGR